MSMKKIISDIIQHWYFLIVIGILLVQLAVFSICGENSYIAVHDNLDLFVTHFKMLKDNQVFFASDATIPMLSGISRDAFASEYSLYNILYFIFPIYVAYISGYFLKIIMGIFAIRLLLKDVLGVSYEKYRPLIYMIGMGYGLIPVFPAYGMAFTSIPLILYLLRRIILQPKTWIYFGVFLYPLVSYFSYFGFFILAYMVLAVIILWIYERKLNKGLVLAIPVLAMGYVIFEYRLFREMLFSNIVSIRTTMVNGEFTLLEVLLEAKDVFIHTIFHAQDSHKYLILPLCILFFVMIHSLSIFRISQKQIKKTMMYFDGVIGMIVFNCLIYGFYDFKPLRELVEMLLPPLTGFQFNRTIYFNPFLWFMALFIVMKFLYDCDCKVCKWVANVLVTLSVLVVLWTPQVYNDFYYTCYNTAYKIVKNQEPSGLSFGEFYSEEFFEAIKEDIGYEAELAIAYGMHPAVLQYNGIATIDGYLGLYSQQYKEDFRELIEPALKESEEFAIYYDTWGARAYIYAGTGENTYTANRQISFRDTSLDINIEAFEKLNGEYIFSRVEISNKEELQLELIGLYEDSTLSPYRIYVYKK